MNVSDTRASGMPVLVGWNRRGGCCWTMCKDSSRAAGTGCLSLSCVWVLLFFCCCFFFLGGGGAAW